MVLPLSLTLALLTTTTAEPPEERINGVIGDVSWTRPTPAALADEATRIQVHLRFVAALLASRTAVLPLSEQRPARPLGSSATPTAGCFRGARETPTPAGARASSTIAA